MGYGRQRWHSHLGCAIQIELVVELELALIERKQSRGFWHNSIMAESYETVRVSRHCVKVKGHAEQKIEKPEQRPLVTISPNYIIPTPTVSVLTSTYANLKKRLRHRKVT